MHAYIFNNKTASYLKQVQLISFVHLIMLDPQDSQDLIDHYNTP